MGIQRPGWNLRPPRRKDGVKATILLFKSVQDKIDQPWYVVLPHKLLRGTEMVNKINP